MARLIVGDKQYVFNANFTSKSDLATELEIPVGTQCRIEHCDQDKLPDEVFEIESWMLRPAPAPAVRPIRPAPRRIRPMPR